jgi:hypothetical protein
MYAQVIALLFETVAGRESWGLVQLAGLLRLLYYVCATAQILSVPPLSKRSQQASRQTVVLAISLLDKCLDGARLASASILQEGFLFALLDTIKLLPPGDERAAGCTRLRQFAARV